MDWDGNQESIRKLLGDIEGVAQDMIYEVEVEERGRMWEQVSKELVEVLTRTESMTRMLKRYQRRDWDEWARK